MVAIVKKTIGKQSYAQGIFFGVAWVSKTAIVEAVLDAGNIEFAIAQD